jgi:hypothetical protein
MRRQPTEAQVNTQEYGRRPYGVGFLVIGLDHTGPHLYEFSPSGTSFEYFAVSIGARSQSAKTYLEKHFESFADCTYRIPYSRDHLTNVCVWAPFFRTDVCRQSGRADPPWAARAPRDAAARQGTHDEQHLNWYSRPMRPARGRRHVRRLSYPRGRPDRGVPPDDATQRGSSSCVRFGPASRRQ